MALRIFLEVTDIALRFQRRRFNIARVRSPVPYFGSPARRLSYFLAACAVAAIQGAGFSFAQDLPADAVELRFGATTVVLDRNDLRSVAGRGKSDLGNRQKFDISPDGPASVALPSQVLTGFSPPCEAITSILMQNRAVPPILRQTMFLNLRPIPIQIGGISRLEPPSGSSILELYQFDSEELRDFWGEQITFSQEAPLIHLDIQVTRDLRIVLGTSARQCFFERGEVFARQLRSFVLSKIRSDR
jgi:hypothetical protein